MFYFLISACQTVSVVNGHQERGRGGEEEDKWEETKVLGSLEKGKPGEISRALRHNGALDTNIQTQSSVMLRLPRTCVQTMDVPTHCTR